ncbi:MULTISPECIES: histidine kinase [Flavobacteriaceae]|uniref:histidine kinase n=1 Tax=Flavobacteriaceae TaxID=49546 RepID=UPI001C0F270C|nr:MULTISPECIES: histidine kinase [Allomuricauda]MDC6366433.1 histidine kinase [Muricauda sp. AC10]
MKDNQFEDILIYFSNSLLGKESEEEILWDLAKNCIAKLGFVDCVIYLIDETNQLLVQKAAYGPKSPKDKTLYNPVQILVGDGISGHVAHTGIPEIINDTTKDSRYIEDDDFRHSEICVPIAHENIIYGVIDCEHPDKGFFTDHHLKMLSAIASICAIKIKSVRANKALITEQQRLFKIKEEMLDLKLKTLNSQLNPHFVFNALNAIQHFITSGKKKEALDYLSVFSRLIRFYLKHLEKDIVILKDEVDMLYRYLKLQKLRYDDLFDYSILFDENSGNPEDAFIPSFVLQSLLEQIIQYHVTNQNIKRHFTIKFNVLDEIVIVQIESEHDDDLETNNVLTFKKSIIEWLDQIELLNSVKNYGLEKNISFSEKIASNIKTISLRLPNLY